VLSLVAVVDNAGGAGEEGIGTPPPPRLGPAYPPFSTELFLMSEVPVHRAVSYERGTRVVIYLDVQEGIGTPPPPRMGPAYTPFSVRVAFTRNRCTFL